MSLKLTKKQVLILEFISEFIKTQGYSPSYREIMTGLGLSSVSAVAEHVDNLIEKGVLEKEQGTARSLKIVDFMHPDTVALINKKLATATPEESEILKKAADILDLDLTSSINLA